MDPYRIFAGNASRKLALSICEQLKSPIGDIDVGRFEDGEVSVRFNENIRGSDVFIVQATGAPADNLMELLVMLDAAKRASARRVTAVMPYFGYARQDRKDQPRAPISAKLVANLITVAGADRALTMDLHSAQIQGFFDIPFDHLYAAPVLVDYFAQKNIKDLMVVAPDIGSVKMARAYAKRLGAELALHGYSGSNPLVTLKLDGGEHSVLIRDVQYDPLTHDILHLDFQHISLTETVEVEVTLKVTGLAIGVKDGGGILEHILRNVEVRCLPTAIPASIDVDVTALTVGDSIHVRDLAVPNVTILTDPDATVATVVAPTVMEEKPVEEAAVATAEEPEVIAKGKKEEEGEEAKEGAKGEVKEVKETKEKAEKKEKK